ncbi:MAG: hypothetical protein QF521_22025 [Alphaproteobacteria bacterium]|jgi:multisubunit Na+/H+ antiporter MnhE subunit|nr:hypothetical protein [Alphaproteobacteria bacterium]
MTVYEMLFAAFVVSIAYWLLCNRLARSIHPFRLEMAEIGESLLADERLPDLARRNVIRELDGAFSPRVAWTMVLLMIPASLIVVWYAIRRQPLPAFVSIPADLRDDWRTFGLIAIASNFASSPLAGIIFAAEFAILILLLVPSGRLIAELQMLGASLGGGNNGPHGERA